VSVQSTQQDRTWHCRLWLINEEHVAASIQRVRPRSERSAHVATTLGVSLSDARLAVRVADGQTNREIASGVDVAVGTINSRLWRLYRKLDIKNRVELASLVSEILGRRSSR
jgi:DNA-binding NarL/FixJ family response regulator